MLVAMSNDVTAIRLTLLHKTDLFRRLDLATVRKDLVAGCYE